MTTTKKALAIQAVKELRKVRAELEPLQEKEKELKNYVKAYLLEHGGKLDTAECTAVIRETEKYRLTDKGSEREFIHKAIDNHIYEALKFIPSVYFENVSENGIEKYSEYAVRITYRKD